MKITETSNTILAAADLLDIPTIEAAKAKTIPYENVTVQERYTIKNFWKKPSFWVVIGTAITAGAGGDYFHAVTAVFSLFGGN
ncbi:hypothetical protein WCX49_06650 [Sulfurimonas sp. HSL-1656]|uniref:hypothetical protein n=1 Tax=Thiomicrolovo subterrani TaxID=3131934 RepID=UPI0031F8FC68